MIKTGFLANGEMLGWEPEKLFSFIAETGFDCVELIDDIIFAGGKPPRYLKEIAAASVKNGVQISEILTQHDLVVLDENARKANTDLIIENMKKAAALGVKTVNVFTGPVPWMPDRVIAGRQVSFTQAWDWVLGSFERILKEAEKLGVRVAVENVWGMLVHDFYTNSYLQSRFDSPSLGVNLDPSHDLLYGNNDMDFLVRSWGKKIFHVHVKDAVGIPEDGKFVFPLIGEGCVNFKAFFAALKDIGYDGCASIEFESWAYRANTLGGSHAASAKPMLEALKSYL